MRKGEGRARRKKRKETGRKTRGEESKGGSREEEGIRESVLHVHIRFENHCLPLTPPARFLNTFAHSKEQSCPAVKASVQLCLMRPFQKL